MMTLGEWIAERIWDETGESPSQIQVILDDLDDLKRPDLERIVRLRLASRYGPNWEDIPVGPLARPSE